jgi:hypothetical protein
VIPVVLDGYPTDRPELGTAITAFSLSIHIYGPGNLDVPPIEIDTPILLHYYVEARQGKRFDTSATDHGTDSVKIVDQVELDIDTSDDASSLQVFSDIPGRTMAARLGTDGQSVAESEGREIRQMVLTEPVVGRLLRYQVNMGHQDTNPIIGMQVYGMRARVLPIGVYLDGAVGDFWAPTPISIGV